MDSIVKRIFDYSLEDIMGERFGTYSKYIIQDRAIPDVRDGLKPVQRRILYAMYMDNNTFDKKFKKCANAVGIVLGKYHPHGDSSVYDALIHLSQDWKLNKTLVEVDGNNGSIDGDPPAAYRYTECRLSKISEELLSDINKFEKMRYNFAPNFDDTRVEPTVLPAKFPNLLVNGTTGISAGYATNMPPHNLGEVVDATIKRIDSPNCKLETIMQIIQGPDFPTGAIACGTDGIKKAFETGKGKVVIRSRYEVIKEKGKEKIIITEIPYGVNKALLIQRIDEIRIDKKIDGISEVRDESDKDANLRIVIDLKPNANKDLILKYLLKNTEMQTTFNYNNVVILNRRPRLLGIIPIIDAYINHQREIVKKSSQWDLTFYKKQFHITEGLIKAISILDEVIKTIRASKNKQDAKDNLVKKYDFTEVQAEAIVMLQLYRLTNTDIVELKEKLEELKALIDKLEGILNDPEKLDQEIKTELRRIKKEYSTPRKTSITDEVSEIKIDATELISEEKVVVVLSKDGYLKRVSYKSFTSNEEQTGLKPGDIVNNLYTASTLDKLIIVTNLGNYLCLPVHQIPEIKWKEMGKHISNIVQMSADEKVVNAFILNKNTEEIPVLTFTKLGLVKSTILKNYNVTRYNKVMSAIKFKDDTDEIIACDFIKDKVLTITENGNYLYYNASEIPLSGVKTSGVKSISLKDDDKVVSALPVSTNDEFVAIFTDNKTAKRVKLSELSLITRAKKGSLIIKKTKTVTYKVKWAILTSLKDNFIIKVGDDLNILKPSEIPIMDLSSTGSSIFKHKVDFIATEASEVDMTTYEKNDKVTSDIDITEKTETVETEKKQTQFQELTIDDFLEEFRI